jgi:hypothetical protein
MSFWEWAIATKVRGDVGHCAGFANPYGDYRHAVGAAEMLERVRKIYVTNSGDVVQLVEKLGTLLKKQDAESKC